jgi:hypothetical protein
MDSDFIISGFCCSNNFVAILDFTVGQQEDTYMFDVIGVLILRFG